MAFPNDGNVENFCVDESGRIERKFWRQSRARGIWTNQIRQGSFPFGMGQVITKVNWNRSNPDGGFSWSAAAIDNGTGSNANPPTFNIEPSWDTYSFQLYYGALNSAPLTLLDLAWALDGPAQLSQIFKNLQENVLDILEDRKQDEYDRVCAHKRICIGASATVESGFNAAYPAVPADSQINLQFLEEAWDDMMRDGGAMGDWGSLEYVQGEPCPKVFISPEGKRAIFRQSEALRNDLRYSSKADWLNAPLAAGKNVPSIRNPNIQTGASWGHFSFGNNLRAPRYNFSNGAYVRVPYYSIVPALTGNAAIPNVAYKTATYEVAYIFHPAVMELLTVNPDPAYNNGCKFDSAQFQGKFKWVNNKDNQFNIDGNQGFFRALLATATRPGLPNLGYSFLYKRCPNDRSAIGCINS